MKKKLQSSFFGNMIIKPEELNYHISPDFHAPFAAAGGSHVAKCEEKASSQSELWKTNSLRKNSEMSTEGAHSKLLLQLFEMPLMRHHVWKSERKFRFRKVATIRFFHSFLFVAISQASLRYAMGVKYEQI